MFRLGRVVRPCKKQRGVADPKVGYARNYRPSTGRGNGLAGRQDNAPPPASFPSHPQIAPGRFRTMVRIISLTAFEPNPLLPQLMASAARKRSRSRNPDTGRALLRRGYRGADTNAGWVRCYASLDISWVVWAPRWRCCPLRYALRSRWQQPARA